MSTLGTRLGRMAWVYTEDEDTLALGFVGEKPAQLRKTPPVEQAALLLVMLLTAVADAGQVFKGKRIARFHRSQDRVGNEVVGVSLKLCPATRRLV